MYIYKSIYMNVFTNLLMCKDNLHSIACIFIYVYVRVYIYVYLQIYV